MPTTTAAVVESAAVTRVAGPTMGDAETQTLVPALAGLVASGRFPPEKLVTHHEFGQIQQAVDDVLAGKTSKPVLRL
ncbi:hypothetical protein Q5425_17285 [Amycolatopsis sp. A133]|uniref:hypothetical protein n=1 Tax=Amycolatopsis sp. A133 TaxID=3064472 RepID=UPI0027EB9B0E|nr:hypothetical protein [Amycolatopsis sp. A133]MDQ7805504.1 hypothetical protein [Amycolatopsis sp. A133]